jgi:hypothetical protein
VLVGSALYARETGEADEERVEAQVGEAPLEAHEEGRDGVRDRRGGRAGRGRRRRADQLPALALARPPRRCWRRGGARAGYRVGQAGGALVYQHGAAGVAARAAPPAGGPATADDDD